MRVALAQINTTVGDLEGNKQKVVDFIKKAKDCDCDLVVFPEMTVCGYPPEDLLHKKHFIARNQKVLRSLKTQVKDIIAVVGFVDSDKNGALYNAAAVFNQGRIAGIYRKERLPNYGVFDEKRYFQRGNNNPVFQVGQCVVGINICEDIWPDDGVHEAQVKAGVDVILNMSCSPYDIGKMTSRRRLLSRRSKEGKVYIGYANLIGGQDEIVFDGGSCMFSPEGRCVASGELFFEDLVVYDIPERRRTRRQKRGKGKVVVLKSADKQRCRIASRKVPAGTEIESIYNALVLGTQDYIRKNGFKRVVVGLSGGVDSALVATIAVDALGKNNVVGVSMPSRYTSKGTRSDAGRVAQQLGIEFHEIPIEEACQAYNKSLTEIFTGQKPDVTEENIQARIRGNILMALSNKFSWLVLTTGNKSEMAVGYCTLYGDMSGGYAVIKDVYKTTVYELARYRNTLNKVIPVSILKRAPSAELRQNQTDQDFLPPYDVLDRILRAYVEEHAAYASIVRKINDADMVKKVLSLVDHCEYKRRQAPPGVKITPRAFGKDWRLPITNRYKNW